jgi:L-ascorbate metabolism protein UlaG (beta-lactamase superfamily)
MDAQFFAANNIKWLGHASFRIDGQSATIYVDPWKLKTTKPADIICITHSHFDHLSEDDINLIKTDTTTIIGPPDCKASFGEAFKTIAPGQSVAVGNIKIEAVPAYNLDKDFHPKKNNWVGYIITVDGVRVYHAGDSDAIPEMVNINTDVALLPVGGTYTMTVDQAVGAVNKMKPKVAIPMHCGDIVGSFTDRNAFQSAAKVPVVILEPTK